VKKEEKIKITKKIGKFGSINFDVLECMGNHYSSAATKPRSIIIEIISILNFSNYTKFLFKHVF